MTIISDNTLVKFWVKIFLHYLSVLIVHHGYILNSHNIEEKYNDDDGPPRINEIGNNYAHFQVSFRAFVEFQAINIMTNIITRNISVYYIVRLFYIYIFTSVFSILSRVMSIKMYMNISFLFSGENFTHANVFFRFPLLEAVKICTN